MSTPAATAIGLPRAIRFPVRLKVEMAWGVHRALGDTRNLTTQGASVGVPKTDDRTPVVGDVVAISLGLPDGPIELSATVAWVDDTAHDRRGAPARWYGLNFLPSPGTTERLQSLVASLRLGVLAVVDSPGAASALDRAVGAQYALEVVATLEAALAQLERHEFGVVVAGPMANGPPAREVLTAITHHFPRDLAVKVLWSDDRPNAVEGAQIFLTVPTGAPSRTLRTSVDAAMQHYWARAEPRLYFYWAQHEAIGGHEPSPLEQRGSALRRLPFFEDLADDALDALSRWLVPVRVRKGQRLFSAGDPDDALYVITSGEARVLAGTREVARIGSGAIVGETALLLQQPRSASVEMTVDSELLGLSKVDFDSLLVQHPAVAVALCRELARRAVAPPKESLTAPMRVVAVVGAEWGARLACEIERLGLQVALLCVDAPLPEGFAERPSVIEAPHHVSELGLTRRLAELAASFDRVVLAIAPQASDVARQAVAQTDAVIGFDGVPSVLKATARRVIERTFGPLRVERVARQVAGRTVGLVLSSGGAWGAAHIGVLRVLHEERVPVDLVAGASIGALFGATFCAGWSLAAMERFARDELSKAVRPTGGLYDPALTPRAGFLHGRKVRRWVDDHLHGATFSRLGTPLHVVCADVSTGAEEVVNTGSVADAVRASIGVPGVFMPWKVGTRYLVDGGMVNPLPLSTAREHGADIIIASSVTGAAANQATRDAAVPSYMAQLVNLMAAMERETLKARSNWADVLIRPDVGRYPLIDYGHSDELVELGEKAARAQLAAIRAVRGKTVARGG